MTPLCIDEQTSALLNTLQATVSISFVEKAIDHCHSTHQNTSAIIYYNPQTDRASAIACEVIRIWLRQLDYDIGRHLYVSTRSHHKVVKVITRSLCDHINDCCNHFKLYTQYLDMGHFPEDFPGHSLPAVLRRYDLKQLKPSFFGIYKAQTVQTIIKTLFTILATQKEGDDYSSHLQWIQQKLPGLYAIVMDFWQQWEAFDVTHIDPIFNSDLELTEKLTQKLEEWAEDKIFILAE